MSAADALKLAAAAWSVLEGIVDSEGDAKKASEATWARIKETFATVKAAGAGRVTMRDAMARITAYQQSRADAESKADAILRGRFSPKK